MAYGSTRPHLGALEKHSDSLDAIDALRLAEVPGRQANYNRIGRYGKEGVMGNASQTTSSGYTGSRNSSIHSTWQGSSTQGRGNPASSQGRDMPGRGSRSSYL